MNREEFDKTARSELFINHWKNLNDSKLYWQIEISPFLSNHGFHYEWYYDRVDFLYFLIFSVQVLNYRL